MGLATVDDSATIGSTEYSLPADTTTGVPTTQTDDCLLQLWLDLSALAAGDVFELKYYEKVAGSGATQQASEPIRFAGPCNPMYTHPTLFFAHGWDITLKKISGTDRAIGWSLRKAT